MTDNKESVIWPTLKIKYTGTYYLNRSFTYTVRINTRGIKFYRNVSDEKQALVLLKDKNLELKLPIRNLIYVVKNNEGKIDHLEMELTQNMRTKVDYEDLDVVQSKPFYSCNGYACYNENGSSKRLHNLILNHTPNDLTVDHINKNPLDNRRCNLRIVDMRTQAINRTIQSNNTSGITGVHYDATNDRWIAKWKDSNGDKCTKWFSCKKYGDVTAKQLAIKAREEAIKSLPHYIDALNITALLQRIEALNTLPEDETLIPI